MKVSMVKVLVGNRVIVRLFDIANTVDLVAGKVLRQTCPQMLANTRVRLLVRFWEF